MTSAKAFGTLSRFPPTTSSASSRRPTDSPGMRAAQAAMREAIDPQPGLRLLDAGCGAGFETARLAEDHPDLQITGLDRNGDLLAIARTHAPQVERLAKPT